MERKFKITVDGVPYIVSVIELVEEGVEPAPAERRPAPAAPTAPAAPAAPQPAPAASAASMSPADKLSPLGGVVAAIEVAEGQDVTEGDRVATIEAMKMKTPISAHRTGKVTRIGVKVGDPVEAGQFLMTIS